MKRATLFLAIVAVIAAFGLTGQAGEKPKGFTYQTLDVPGAENSWPWVINARGDIAGNYERDGVLNLFLLRNGQFQTIPPPDPRLFDMWVEGLSATGAVGISYLTHDPCPNCPFYQDAVYHGVIWRDGLFESVEFPGAVYTNVGAINARGDVVGGTFIDNKAAGYIRTRDGAYTLLEVSDVPGDSMSVSTATGVNDHGDVAGWIGDMNTGEFHAYLLRDGHLTPIRVPGFTFVAATSLNNRGEVVLTCDSGKNYVWKDDVLTEVAMPGAEWTSVWGINDQGTVVGYYGTADGKTHGFVATR